MWTLQIMLDLFCRFLFRSGNQEHPGDKIENTTVEILPVSVGKYFPHTHTYCLSTLCGVMCKRFWLDYTERLLFGTKRIDYRQECERDWIICSATGDAFWHCDSHMLGICSSAAQVRKLKKGHLFSRLSFCCPSFTLFIWQEPGLQTKEKYKRTEDRFYRIGKCYMCVCKQKHWNIMFRLNAYTDGACSKRQLTKRWWDVLSHSLFYLISNKTG